MSVHFCHPWSGDCALPGLRLNLWLGRHFIGIAFTPGSRFARLDGASWVIHHTKGNRS